MDRFSPKPFADAARAAFPIANRAVADQAVSCLASFVDDTFRRRSFQIYVLGQDVRLPTRLHFPGLAKAEKAIEAMPPSGLCLLSRATNGYLRHYAASMLLETDSAWVAPYVTALLADYVYEIVEVIANGVPVLNRDVYANFVRENRNPVRTFRARAISYWNEYYRQRHPERHDYPGLKACMKWRDGLPKAGITPIDPPALGLCKIFDL